MMSISFYDIFFLFSLLSMVAQVGITIAATVSVLVGAVIDAVCVIQRKR